MWFLVAFIFLVHHNAASSPFEKLVRQYVQPKLNLAALKNNHSAIALTLKTANETITLIAGNRAPGVPLEEENSFLWGSLTKLVTAAMTLKLNASGVLNLDDPIHTVLNPFLFKNNGSVIGQIYEPSNQTDMITARQLIGMNSSIGDFDTQETANLQFNDVTRDLSPFDDIYLAPKELTCEFCANYSSTNFVVAGLVLAAAMGVDSWQDLNQKHVLPKDAYYYDKFIFPQKGICSSYETDEIKIVHGYTKGKYGSTKILQNKEDKLYDSYDMSCLGGWTCGNTVASVPAMANFTYDLFGPQKKIIPETYVKQMTSDWKETDPKWFKSQYGLGTMLLQNSTEGPVYGHGGETYGFTGASVYVEKNEFVISINQGRDATLGGIDIYRILFQTIKYVNKIIIEF